MSKEANESLKRIKNKLAGETLEETSNTKVLGDVVIQVDHVSRTFTLNNEKLDNIKEYVIKLAKGEIKKDTFLALDDVSFKVHKGERLGLVGLNGAGKSTLLKILSGVLKPSKGTLEVHGKLAPLLELGAGVDHNYTGRENIFLNGSFLGFSRDFMEEKYDEIEEFSELGRFIDVPVKNYSSGMKAKLGFSVATIVDPDILILDEVLSVGDAKFRKKSNKKMMEMIESGVTVIMVSHSINNIREICNKAIWLEKGKIVMQGDAETVCNAYQKSCDA